MVEGVFPWKTFNDQQGNFKYLIVIQWEQFASECSYGAKEKPVISLMLL